MNFLDIHCLWYLKHSVCIFSRNFYIKMPTIYQLLPKPTTGSHILPMDFVERCGKNYYYFGIDNSREYKNIEIFRFCTDEFCPPPFHSLGNVNLHGVISRRLYANPSATHFYCFLERNGNNMVAKMDIISPFNIQFLQLVGDVLPLYRQHHENRFYFISDECGIISCSTMEIIAWDEMDRQLGGHYLDRSIFKTAIYQFKLDSASAKISQITDIPTLPTTFSENIEDLDRDWRVHRLIHRINPLIINKNANDGQQQLLFYHVDASAQFYVLNYSDNSGTRKWEKYELEANRGTLEDPSGRSTGIDLFDFIHSTNRIFLTNFNVFYRLHFDNNSKGYFFEKIFRILRSPNSMLFTNCFGTFFVKFHPSIIELVHWGLKVPPLRFLCYWALNDLLGIEESTAEAAKNIGGLDQLIGRINSKKVMRLGISNEEIISILKKYIQR